jgi:hypothetical protein
MQYVHLSHQIPKRRRSVVVASGVNKSILKIEFLYSPVRQEWTCSETIAVCADVIDEPSEASRMGTYIIVTSSLPFAKQADSLFSTASGREASTFFPLGRW